MRLARVVGMETLRGGAVTSGRRASAVGEALSPRRERLLSLGNQSLEQALARAGDGVFVVADGRIVLWNGAAERILGRSAREVLGKSCCDVLKGVDPDGNRLCYEGCHVLSLVARREPVHHFEMETRTKTGMAVWLDISILDVRATEAGRAMTVHLFRDVTAARNLLQMVRERLAAVPGFPNGSEASILTRREVQILQLMAAGANTKAMAERLHLSPATIRNHAQNIFSKLNLHSRLEAVAWANRNRLA